MFLMGPSWPSHTILWLNSNLGKIPRKSNRPDNWVGTHGPMESIRGGVIKWCLGRSLHHVGLITELITEEALSDQGTIKYLAPDKNQKPGKILLSTGCFLFQWQISQSRSSLRLSWALQIIWICLLEPGRALTVSNIKCRKCEIFWKLWRARAGPRRPYFNLSVIKISEALKPAFLPFKSVHSQHVSGIKVC